MKRLGPDAALLPVHLEGDTVMVDGEAIGELAGFRFKVDPAARHGDHKLLLAAAERHVPALLAARAEKLAAAIAARDADTGVELRAGAILWHGDKLATLERGKPLLSPRLSPIGALSALPAAAREALSAALEQWLARKLRVLAPLARIETASTSAQAGPELRALLIRLAESGGMMARATSGLEKLDKRQRDALRRLGVKVGALDLFHPALLRRAPLRLWCDLGGGKGPVAETMPPVLPARESTPRSTLLPLGYRAAGEHWLRLDFAEALLREAHGRRVERGGRAFGLDPGAALAAGLATAGYARLLRAAGFRPLPPKPLAAGMFGPPAPLLWRWSPPRADTAPAAPPPPEGGAFAALSRLVA